MKRGFWYYWSIFFGLFGLYMIIINNFESALFSMIACYCGAWLSNE